MNFLVDVELDSNKHIKKIFCKECGRVIHEIKEGATLLDKVREIKFVAFHVKLFHDLNIFYKKSHSNPKNIVVAVSKSESPPSGYRVLDLR